MFGTGKKTRAMAAAVAILLSGAHLAHAQECMTDVSGAMDRQRQSYISAQGTLADQNYSRRPGSFASTTCLDNLMTGGGLDIFFKPPSLDNILGMVKNLACEQASQIFDQLLGGSGINGGGGLGVGEIMSGVNLGGGLVKIGAQQGSGSIGRGGDIMEMFR